MGTTRRTWFRRTFYKYKTYSGLKALEVFLKNLGFVCWIMTDSIFVEEWRDVPIEKCMEHCWKDRRNCKQMTYIANNTCHFINGEYS